MKKTLALLLAAVSMTAMFSSCSEDSPAPAGSALEAKTYTETEGLSLTSDGTAATGQSVTFTPTDKATATLTIKGENLDIAGLIPMAVSKENAGMVIPTSSIIPGSPEVTFDVQLIGEEDNASFAGVSETDYCTFAYSGKVSAEALSLNLSDITLKNISMAGTFKTHAFEDNFFNVCHVEWVSEKGIELFPGFAMPVKDIVRMALALPLIPIDEEGNNASVAGLLPQVLKSVTFGKDGSVTAVYAESDGKGNFTEREAPKGLARYVVKDDNTILLFLDPKSIVANTIGKSARGASRALDFGAIIDNLMKQVVPMAVNGIPVHHGPRIKGEEYQDGTYVPVYDTDPNAMCFYLGTETLLPILKMAVPVLTDPEVINLIMGAVSQDPSMKDMADLLKSVLNSLPSAIETTSKVEVGINLYK